MRISPTRSGFIFVGVSRPLGHRSLFTLMPSRWILMSRALTPAKLCLLRAEDFVIRQKGPTHDADQIQHVVAHERQILNLFFRQHLTDRRRRCRDQSSAATETSTDCAAADTSS